MHTSNARPLSTHAPCGRSDDVDFFTHMEMYMRQEKPTLCGRDHISYRSYYLPAKVSEQLSRTLRWFEGTRLLKRFGSMFFVSTIYAILSSLRVGVETAAPGIDCNVSYGFGRPD